MCVSAPGAEWPSCQPEGAEGWPEPRAWSNYLRRFAQVSTLFGLPRHGHFFFLNIFLTLLRAIANTLQFSTDKEKTIECEVPGTSKLRVCMQSRPHGPPELCSVLLRTLFIRRLPSFPRGCRVEHGGPADSFLRPQCCHSAWSVIGTRYSDKP